MPRILIDELDDPRIAVYRSLKATNQTRGLEQFVVEGEKLVDRLIASRFPLASVLLTDRHERRLSVTIPDTVPRYVVPYDLVHEIVGFPFHRGILGCGVRLPDISLAEILHRGNGQAKLVVCPRISNPDNLGSIARISDVFGIDAILVGPSCPDPLSRRVLRVSMGSTLRVPVMVQTNLPEAVDQLIRDWKVEVMAAVADPSAEVFDAFEVPDRWALVMGNEDEGVEEAWLSKAQRAVTIPMTTSSGSLNVAVAAGILLYRLGIGARG